jgi:GntR family transcriptional regulator, arabinose operon transcriptional repressor
VERHGSHKYLAIYRHFRRLIVSGVLPAGHRLPTEKAIEQEFGVSRITAVRALSLLMEEGLIERVQGSGSYVRGPVPRNDTTLQVVSLVSPIRNEGREIELIKGIENRLRQAGFLLSVSNSHDKLDIERQIVASVRDKVQGLIIYPVSSIENLDLFQGLTNMHHPVVYVDRYPMSLPCTYVSCDNFDGGYRIGKAFLDRGHSRIALIYHDIVGLTSDRDRFNGFMKAMGEGNVPRDRVRIISMPKEDSEDSIHRVLRELYSDVWGPRENCPSAVFTFNDHIALRLMDCIRKNREYVLPDNFLLAGFDDLAGPEEGIPFLTMHQDYYAIGEKAAELLVEKIQSQSMTDAQHLVPVHLVEYAAPPAVSSAAPSAIRPTSGAS